MRGISIVLVLLHHFNIAYRMNDTLPAELVGWAALNAVFRNGNYAVTAFFVISGFLITTNADRQWRGLQNVRATTFYRNRGARIVPCLLLLLVIVNGLAAVGVEIFKNHPEFGGPISFWVVDLASLTFWMNVLMGHTGWLNYALCVQWSLSIEEVFYLSFPIFCLLLRRDGLLMAAWSLFIVLGPFWRATHQATEYGELYSYFSCFDGIAFGCCAAILSKHVRLPPWSTTPAQALLASGMAWFYLSGWIGDTAVYGVTVIALGTAMLLIVETQEKSSRSRLTAAFEPLRRCGRLSYELYLFHLIALGIFRTIWPPNFTSGDPKLLLLAAYLMFSAALAVFVSKYYSDPLNRRLRTRRSSSLREMQA